MTHRDTTGSRTPSSGPGGRHLRPVASSGTDGRDPFEAAQSEFWGGLEMLGESRTPEHDTVLDQALIEDVLEVFRSEPLLEGAQVIDVDMTAPARNRRRTTQWVGAGLAGAIAAGLALIWRLGGAPSTETAPQIQAPGPTFVEATVRPRVPEEQDASGSRIDHELGCMDLSASTKACFEKGARFRLRHAANDELAVVLDRGRLELWRDSGSTADLVVHTSSGRVRPGEGRFVLDASGTTETVTIITLVGTAEVQDAGGHRSTVSSGSTMTLGRTSTRQGAPLLLERAQRLRAQGRLRGALESYRELVRKYPRSGEAHAASISLGELQLTDAPSEALLSFEHYLSGGGGALAQEAEYGRIRALLRLGRKEHARAAARTFLKTHPDGIYAASLRKRADLL